MPRALVVDDEQDIREGLSRMPEWTAAGFKVIGTAENGFSAMKLFLEQRPELVMVDIKMPGMDGLELSRKLREADPDVCIIILSGYNQFDYAKQAIEYGVSSYLLKPIIPCELEETLLKLKDVIARREATRLLSSEKDSKMMSYFMKRLIRGAATPGEAARTMEMYRIGVKCMKYRMAAGVCTSPRDAKDCMENRFALQNIMREILPNGDIFFWLSEGLFAVLFQRDARVEDEAMTCEIREILGRVEAMGVDCFRIGVGGVAESVRDILDSFAEALLEASRPDRGLPAVFSERPRLCEGESEQVEALCRTIVCSTSTAEDTERALDAILARPPTLGGQQSARFAGALAASLARLLAVQSDFPDMALLGRLAGLTALDPRFADEKARRELCEVCLEIAGLFRGDGTGKAPQNTVQAAISWIGMNFREQFTLKEAADRFFLHPFYLGKQIKDRTGCSFNEHINTLRIAEAKKLLEATDFSISRIATAVGYRYLDHFYRYFKRIVGINPGEYRVKCHKP